MQLNPIKIVKHPEGWWAAVSRSPVCGRRHTVFGESPKQAVKKMRGIFRSSRREAMNELTRMSQEMGLYEPGLPNPLVKS